MVFLVFKFLLTKSDPVPYNMIYYQRKTKKGKKTHSVLFREPPAGVRRQNLCGEYLFPELTA